jgi:hypothetical protein
MEERRCALCGEIKPLNGKYFYSKKKRKGIIKGKTPLFDYYCIKCRIKITVKYQKCGENYYIEPEGQDYVRDTPDGWQSWMKKNTFAFEDTFRVSPTPENIKRVAQQLF